MGFGGTPMLRLLYKHNEQRLDGPGGTWGPPLRSGHSSISRKAVGRPMMGLLLELADAVQHAVAAIEGDPSEVLGRGAAGAPSTRIDGVAEEGVLRAPAYEGAARRVLSAAAWYGQRGGKVT